MRTLAFCLALLLHLGAREACAPPYAPPADAIRVGCHINLITDDFNNQWWHVRVWADRPAPEPKWAILFAVRESNQRRRALLDCEAWLKCAQKQLRGSRAK